MQDFVQTDLIYMTMAGSIMFGTNTPESDVDKRGICVPPKNYLLGFARNFEQQEVSGEDTVIFALKKFMQLACEGNPNYLEILFAPDECVLTEHPTWLELKKHRTKFLVAEAFPRFMGYATSQMKRMLSHKEWILHPPTKKPARADYGLPEKSTGTKELADEDEISPEIKETIKQERIYKADSAQWKQYEDWMQTRNPKRFAIEARIGYDSKNGSHLLRTLRMLKELLLYGEMIVKRPDAKELLAIRQGEWSLEKLMDAVDALRAELNDIYDTKKYVIPHKLDRCEISDLCVELHEFHWKFSR